MRSATPLVALASQVEGANPGTLELRSPAVGILRGVPTPGHLLGPGEPFATLTLIDRTHDLLVPEGVAGVVAELSVPGFGADAIPVPYGQPILRLAPIEAGLAAGSAAESVASLAGHPKAAAESVPEGCHAVICPADGIFYRRPRPTDPPYVQVGVRVHEGQTIALIEAMKCFSAIAYGGPGLPEQAEIVEVRPADASEVRHGQVLFVVR